MLFLSFGRTNLVAGMIISDISETVVETEARSDGLIGNLAFWHVN